jgi:predicted XRE-type DNA-binding protein
MTDKTKVRRSEGSIFEELGLPDAPTLTLKADLAAQISLALEDRGWSQQCAAAELKIDQPSISKILSGKLRGFSVERLMQLLIALDRDVLVCITPSELEGHGRIVVQTGAEG